MRTESPLLLRMERELSKSSAWGTELGKGQGSGREAQLCDLWPLSHLENAQLFGPCCTSGEHRVLGGRTADLESRALGAENTAVMETCLPFSSAVFLELI